MPPPVERVQTRVRGLEVGVIDNRERIVAVAAIDPEELDEVLDARRLGGAVIGENEGIVAAVGLDRDRIVSRLARGLHEVWEGR